MNKYVQFLLKMENTKITELYDIQSQFPGIWKNVIL